MDFEKLPSNSERLLHKIVSADNPVNVLRNLFEKASPREDDELRGIIRELRQKGYIDVKWGSNLPLYVVINNSARVYEEQNAEHTAQKARQTSQEEEVTPVVFISHRSTDKEVADMLADFLSATGISKNKIFCSSLPGNDINEKISNEVKTALKNSSVNIAILSYDYYQSAYCLNEAGVLWYNDVPVIPIALPEINANNMYGFLNNEYKLRRLDSDTDISYIYDTVNKAVSSNNDNFSIVTFENNKLRARYANFLKLRKTSKPTVTKMQNVDLSSITTDDERVVLYYILKQNIRKVSKSVLLEWLHKNEIYNINVDNAFDLLSSIDGGLVKNNTLEFGIEAFRKYSANAESLIPTLKKFVDDHTKLAINSFKYLWEAGSIDDTVLLFIAYIIDEKMCSFGDRWMSDMQIESIKSWEDENSLDSTLSDHYGSCLQFMIQNDLVYESDWTRYNNPREYSLCTSLEKFLFNCPKEYVNELEKVKDSHTFELPF